MNKLILSVVVLAAGGGATWWFGFHNGKGDVKYRLGKVEKGDLRVTVTATGTVQPFLLVQVGTQVTGTIQKLLVDFNSKVKANQVVAQIDPAPFQAKVDQDKANLVQAEANVIRVKAMLTQADKELVRSRELQKKELISPSDLDTAIATYDSLVAQVKVADATVVQAQAQLESSMVNLRYCTIVSPIDGIVIARSVDVGQTVAASLAAPTIYIIADGMKKIQVQASVAEADIGRIKDDMEVTFAVDAHRNDTFKGKVTQIRLSPTTVQNVVTYTVIIDADNPEGKLLPGMTANVSFEIAQYNDVVKIPNAALRFTPPGAMVEPPAKDPPPKKDASADGHAARKGEGDGPPKSEGDPSHKAPVGTAKVHDRRNTGHVWVLGADGNPSMISVTTDATDGAYTRMMKGELAEGQEVLIGIVADGGDAMTNPFAPGRSGPARPR
ncbi:MAG TPA: efflux RND transporter periplasmic adaptor subunit [Planctomycetota bacterium]|jgi:HlyD family secretion protein|nr:efflux RND transporter periplasmic adaptor subunit [Planctomycetota bacterium]